jgi:hypothetical protein
VTIGNYVGEDGKRRKLGSRISEAAGRGGGNFLTPEIAHIARRETAYREIGAMIDAEPLATNLLSSMPLTFNLLAPWGHALERASSYLIELLPAFTAAHQLLFEHSPGRGNSKFTGDYTAFDALIRYTDVQGRNGFVAFEIKYSESMREPMPELKPRYDELSDASGLFVDPAAAALRSNPQQQLWREHLLAQSMIDNGLYDEGYLVVIAPDLNYHVQDAAEPYQAQLQEPEDGKVRFVNLTLEDVIEVIRLSDPAHAEALHRRYCDFWLVDGELELNAAQVGLPAKRASHKSPQAPEDAATPVPGEHFASIHPKISFRGSRDSFVLDLAGCVAPDHLETVHPQGPLVAYETALNDWQKAEREDEGYSRPDHGVQQDRCVGPEFLDKDHGGANDVADHEDRHIGRRVVGTLMKQFLAAMRAGVVDLEIGAKHLALPTIGTTAVQALANGLPWGAAVFIGRQASSRNRRIGRCLNCRRTHHFFLPLVSIILTGPRYLPRMVSGKFSNGATPGSCGPAGVRARSRASETVPV